MKKNNIKKFTSTFIALVLALSIATAANYVLAGPGFQGPPSQFPDCPTTTAGCNQPINVSVYDQAKDGGLSIGGPFIGEMNSEFMQDLRVDGNTDFKQNVTVDQLAGSSDHTVCADPSGRLILCNLPGGVLVDPSYNQGLSVTGIQGFTQSPSTATSVTGPAKGTHTAFTGAIGLTISTTSSVQPGSIVALEVNGNPVECKNTTTLPRSTSFTSRTYTLSDSITIASLSAGSLSSCN